MILRLAEYVFLLLIGRTIGEATPRAVLRDTRILSKPVVECTLLVSRQMLRAESAAVAGNVHVTATAVICVNDRSGMQIGQLLLRPLLLNHKGT